MKSQIGWIGLGIMGYPMARNLLQAGYSVMAYDIDPQAVERLCRDGAVPASLEEIGRQCDIIITILPNGSIVKGVLLGPDGVSAGLKPGALVIDMSSVTPMESREMEKGLEPFRAAFLDAPVSGGEEGAINGTLAIMAGGKEADFQRAQPVFQVLGSSSVLVGGTGSGSVAKLANQVIVNLNIAAVSEALVLAKKAGADPRKVFEAIRGGLAGSQVLEDKAPRMIDRRFEPGGKISINHKDIKNVMQSAHDFDVPLPMTSMLFEIMCALKVGGHFQEDHSAIVQYFEKLADIEV